MNDRAVAILACGSRGWSDIAPVRSYLDQFRGRRVLVISGGARGADTIAEIEAVKHYFAIHVVRARWDLLGRRAGIVRNTEMAELMAGYRAKGYECHAVAFYDGHSRGTRHMISVMEHMGFHVDVIRAAPRVLPV